MLLVVILSITNPTARASLVINKAGTTEGKEKAEMKERIEKGRNKRRRAVKKGERSVEEGKEKIQTERKKEI